MQLDDDGYLPLAEVELGHVVVVVAHGGDAQGVTDGGAGHTQIGGTHEVRTHGDFRANQAGTGCDGAQPRDGAQITLHRRSRRGQGLRVFAGQHQLVFLTRAAQAHFAAHTRQLRHGSADVVLNELFARALAPLAQEHRQRGLAHFRRTRWRKRIRPCGATANGGVNALNVLHAAEQMARGLCGIARLAQRRARWQLQVHLGLRVVIRRNKSGGQQRDEHDGAYKKRSCCAQRDPAMSQRPATGAQVGRHPKRLFVWLGAAPHHVGRHHGCEHPSNHKRGKHGQRGRPAKLLEKFAGNAGHKCGRQKHRNQREGGSNHRKADFVGRLHGGLKRCFAHVEVALNVLHLHDGIVHQHANHQRQCQQGHGVDRETQVGNANKRWNHRQRQRHGRDNRGAPIAQKQPHHNHREQSTLKQHGHGGLKLFGHRFYKVKRLGNFKIRVLGFELLQRRVHGRAHLDLAGAFAAGDLKTHHRYAVEQGQRARFGHGVLDRGDVTQTHPSTFGQAEFQICQGRSAGDSGHRAHGLLAAGQIGPTACAFGLHLSQLARNFRGRGAQAFKFEWVQCHINLAGHAAHTAHRAHAFDAQQSARHCVVHKPTQGLVVHAGRTHGKCQYRRAGEIDLANNRVAHVCGQVRTNTLHRRAHIVHGFLGGFLKAKFGCHRDAAVLHLGVNVFQALQGSNRVLNLARHLGLELRGRRAGQRGRNHHGGQFQVRELLHLHGLESQHARKAEHHKQHHRRNGVFDGPG